MIVEGQQFPFVILVLFWGLVVYVGWTASKGKPLQLRRLVQIDAIDEAVGRCAEMGRPCVHFPGSYSTAQKAWLTVALAGINCLRHVSYQCATAGVPFYVGSITLDLIPLMDDVVRSSYLEAGHIDDYDSAEQIRYIGSSGQTSQAPMVLRLKPAYVSMIGSYSSDFIFGAEPAKRVGAVVISGDARMSQQATMAVTSDYFLCGEEVYAASAYITKDPLLLGQVVGQDFCEFIFILMLIVGFILSGIGFENVINTLLSI
ncbi:MAG: DUF6754 domain-containing protein [Candidatus Hodarchaeota archaeon]